jgi:hypothetical protein
MRFIVRGGVARLITPGQSVPLCFFVLNFVWDVVIHTLLTLRDKPVNLNDIPTKRGKRVS